MGFPVHRPRRLRRSALLRDLVSETRLSADRLIWPLFVRNGTDVARPIASMPGVFQLSVDRLVGEAARAADVGVRAVLLFGIPDKKDATGSTASRDDGPVPRAVRAIKEKKLPLAVITDVCLCEYTDHGHCGMVTPGGEVDNDSTLEVLAAQALSHARAGADWVAPSDMMDGRVAAIRRALDANGFSNTAILSYAAKFASSFYAPFRDAAESKPQFGDRRSYQMDSRNAREALREIRLDIEEGADLVMVKPALAYLDVVRAAREASDVPLVAYNVSGEMSLVEAAAEKGWIDRRPMILEILTAIHRAGADLICTYWAREVAEWLSGSSRK
ncbi:MAG: porphobilinogen synthase [Planctomycetes bacterium]|nr:porphobilinogen synthase [Planctomycetota bacterium]MBI3844607.1 porphobilinogen synthase [Planctomycetota bacterium]